jgi:hypothetical protein
VLDERRRNGILLSTATLAPSPRGAQPPRGWQAHVDRRPFTESKELVAGFTTLELLVRRPRTHERSAATRPAGRGGRTREKHWRTGRRVAASRAAPRLLKVERQESRPMYSRDGDHASRQGYPHSTGGAGGATAQRAMVPGKRTLVEDLQVRSGVMGAPATVQRKVDAAKPAGVDAAKPAGEDAAKPAEEDAGHDLPADGGGAAMPAEVQRKMEQAFGTSFAPRAA